MSKINDRTRPLAEIAAQLRDNPRKWVRLARGDESRMSARAASWRRRQPAAFSDGRYKFKTQRTKAWKRDGGYYVEVWLLGRYNG